jgi:hypothetical protein
MVRPIILAILLSGCVVRATEARDATLHFHPTLDELRTAPAAQPGAPPAPRAVAARLVFHNIASAYPQPIGLDYDDSSILRKVTGVQWSNGELEHALAGALPEALVGGDGAVVHVDGAVVNLAIYRVSNAVYGRALFDLRIARDGNEVYAVRYTASRSGSDRDQLFAALAADLTTQVTRDERLASKLAGGKS